MITPCPHHAYCTEARYCNEIKNSIGLSAPNLYRLLCFQVSAVLGFLLKFRIRSIILKVFRFVDPSFL